MGVSGVNGGCSGDGESLSESSFPNIVSMKDLQVCILLYNIIMHNQYQCTYSNSYLYFAMYYYLYFHHHCHHEL